MTRRTKILIGLSGSLLFIVVAAAFAIYFLLTKSHPQVEGTLPVRGLSSPVEVFRDEAGIPHIIAQNEYDAYFTAGFVHAQDRLWQMDLSRRYGQGRLAEVLGGLAVPIDRLMRTIGIHRIADTLLQSLPRQTKNILSAYTNGVNACIDQMKGKYPIEFDLLQYEPEPWTERDCVIIGRVMGWELAVSWWVDLVLADLVETVGEEKAREVFPYYRDDAPVIIPSQLAYDRKEIRAFQESYQYARAFLKRHGSAVGSNSWSVTGSRSVTGLPLLANDPHLIFMQPARWYIMHLNAPGLNVAGVSLPGAPGIVIGRNDDIAWGLTNVMNDDVDFYIEQVSYRDSVYEYRGSKRRLVVRTDSIFVKDSLPVVHTVHETHNGPLIQSVYTPDRYHKRRERAASISMRWTGYEKSDEILALYKVNHAKSWSEFRDALRSFGLPGQNFMYADRAGNIGFQAAALVPKRAESFGVLPSDGQTGDGEWLGFIPFDELPSTFNPPSEFLATANNKITAQLPYYLSNLWEGESRITRIREMLAEQPQFSAADFRLMQMDVKSPYASGIRDEFVRALLSLERRSSTLTNAMNLLAQWDLRMSSSSSATALFNVAYQHLLTETLEDEMGKSLFDSYVWFSNVPVRVMPKLLADTAATWFDNVRTPEGETKSDIVVQCIQRAMEELSERFGSDMEKWKWGDIHTVTFMHPLGEVTPLNYLFNVGPLVVGGHTTTINNGEYRFTAPYDVGVGPSMRFIADLAVQDTCYIILTTGQSGQPLSKHYSDQAALWQNGAYRTLLTNPKTIRNMHWDKLTLEPM